MTEKAAFLALLQGSPRRWAVVAEHVEELGSATALISGSVPGQQSLFGADEHTGSRIEEAEALIAAWEHDGMHFATLLDDDYPFQLLTIHQRPPFVMWRGTQSPDDSQGVAIVGTRQASADGVARARSLAAELAECGVTVISGLAAGIDTAAHLGALEAGGRTVAVIGTGLRRSYPAQNADLQNRIANEGMVLTQFLPDAPPTKQSFPMRNAVMSGYAAATVVIEAAWKSGARMQARLALEHGRPVFLLRSLLEHDWAREYARRPGASVIDTVDDVVGQLDSIALRGDELSWA
jgi:DNA processing protein